MKKTIISSIVFASMFVVGAVPNSFADENDGATRCTVKTLKGRYLFAASSITFPPVVTQPTYSARAGYRIFNGDGTGTVIATFSDNGVITMPDVHVDLSYTINADCTGTYTVLNPAALTAEIFVAPNREELVAIETSKGRANDAFSSRRVGPE
jgi:hypothetical protein